MTIITVTVLLVIGILSFVTYNYYYVTATDVLKRHANASAVLFANSGLAYDYTDSEATIHDVLDSYAYPDAEIEVLDATGIPRYSSTGFISQRKLTREAVNQVRNLFSNRPLGYSSLGTCLHLFLTSGVFDRSTYPRGHRCVGPNRETTLRR